MKVGLINPPSPFLIDERVFISLGILRVASSLEPHHEVKFLDLAGISDWKCELVKLKDCDVIGISSTTPQIPYVTEIAEYIKENMKIKIILGGPHATMIFCGYKSSFTRAHKEIERLKNIFDVIVVGDGELAVFEAIKDDAPQIINSEEDERLFINDVKYSTIPLPARHLVDMKSYHYDIDGLKATNIISQMGCPFQCGFCGGRRSKTFRKIRKRSVESVIDEIDHLYKTYGYKGFMCFDDEINVNPKLFINLLNLLCDYQKKNSIQFNFRGFTRSDLLTQEQADKMYKAGFRWLLTGFESGSDRILVNMNKGVTVKDNTKAFEMARNAGLKIKALMSIGHPGESKETIEQTRQWLQAVQPDDTDITIISTYPGTAYYDESFWNYDKQVWQYQNSKTGDKLYSVEIDYTTDSTFYKSDPENYKAYVFTDYLSCQDLVDERKKLEEMFKCN